MFFNLIGLAKKPNGKEIIGKSLQITSVYDTTFDAHEPCQSTVDETCNDKKILKKN